MFCNNMKTSSKTSWALATLTIAILGATISAGAQEMPEERQSMTITAGTVFEILGVGDARDTQFSWVLTKNREFIEAARGPIFRIRLAQPGTYLLQGGAFTSESTLKRTSVSITIVPAEHTEIGSGSSFSSQSPGAELLVATDPPLIRDAIPTGPDADIVRLLPIAEDVELNLDIDNARDTDGDGDTQNDIDNPTTFFKTDGTPLALWFASDREKRILTIHTETGTEFARTQEITIFHEAEGIARQGILAEKQGPGRVRLRVQFRGNEPPEAPLFYRWDFGDDGTSVAETPLHAYTASGSYTVSVEVIDLEMAKTVFAGTKIVSVSEGAPEGGGTIIASSSSSSASSESAEEPVAEGSSLVWTIAKGLLWLLLSAGIGFLIMFVLGNIRRSRGLQQGLASMEEKLTKKDAPVSLLDSAPPMELKRAEKVDEPKNARNNEPKPVPPSPAAPKAPPRPTPTPNDGPTPAWLKAAPPSEAMGSAMQFQKPPMPQANAAPVLPTPAPVTPKPSPVATSSPIPPPPKPVTPVVKSEVPAIPTPKPAAPIELPKVVKPVIAPSVLPPPPPLPELLGKPVTPSPKAPEQVKPAEVPEPKKTADAAPTKPTSDTNPDDTDPTVAIIKADSLQ